MKEPFDFENISKKTPYKIPDNFFNNLEKEIKDKTINKKQKNQTVIYYITAFSSIAASVALFIQFSKPNDSINTNKELAQKETITLESTQKDATSIDTLKNNIKSTQNISTSETSLDDIIKNTPTNELKDWEDMELDNELELENELEEF